MPKPNSGFRAVSYALLGLAIAATVIGLAPADPVGVWCWAIAPYFCGMLLDLTFHRGRLEPIAVSIAALAIVAFGLLTNADGLIFHWGVFVMNDVDTSHLATLFAPLYQLTFLLMAALALAFLRLVLLIRRRSRSPASCESAGSCGTDRSTASGSARPGS